MNMFLMIFVPAWVIMTVFKDYLVSKRIERNREMIVQVIDLLDMILTKQKSDDAHAAVFEKDDIVIGDEK